MSLVKRPEISWWSSAADTSWKWHLFSRARARPSSSHTCRAWHRSCLFPTSVPSWWTKGSHPHLPCRRSRSRRCPNRCHCPDGRSCRETPP
ncbi:hypothetical protein ANANG_G00202290 [Anguilla anguilla]|uniref:Uncharacterized protein n=1 Tax=Anguilla anguilla TaxID=7936 RepID=A0A9D3M1R6_ANGAN|nr:hypothetical protein ANANG_G00202290 [Anguilla anguilla]